MSVTGVHTVPYNDAGARRTVSEIGCDGVGCDNRTDSDAEAFGEDWTTVLAGGFDAGNFHLCSVACLKDWAARL